jgi:hypothetical protein
MIQVDGQTPRRFKRHRLLAGPSCNIDKTQAANMHEATQMLDPLTIYFPFFSTEYNQVIRHKRRLVVLNQPQSQMAFPRSWVSLDPATLSIEADKNPMVSFNLFIESFPMTAQISFFR